MHVIVNPQYKRAIRIAQLWGIKTI